MILSQLCRLLFCLALSISAFTAAIAQDKVQSPAIPESIPTIHVGGYQFAPYVHQQQERYRNQIVHTQRIISQAESSKEKLSATNLLNKLIEQERELKGYEEKLKHLADQRIELDLDDGVTVNYAKFDGLLSPIK